MNVCGLIECSTTAGCAHRGPEGQLCYFGGSYDSGYLAGLEAAAKVAILDERDVPKAAKHDVIKMRWYQWGKDDASQEIYDAILALGDSHD